MVYLCFIFFSSYPFNIATTYFSSINIKTTRMFRNIFYFFLVNLTLCRQQPYPLHINRGGMEGGLTTVLVDLLKWLDSKLEKRGVGLVFG